MSELAKQLFESLKAGAQRFVAEVGATLDQKVSQGASELANALNHESDGFVLYGPGQNPNMWAQGHDQQPDHGHEQSHEHDLSRER
jgi:hypothetical protein